MTSNSGRPIKNREYSSPKKRADWATALLVILGIFTVFSIVGAMGDIGTLQDMKNGEPLTAEELEARGGGVPGAEIIGTALSIGIAVAFLIWLFKASSNLASLGTRGQKFSPTWAVLWWFIPIAWLFMPYFVMKEIWEISHPEGTGYEMSPLIGPWWITWLISGWASDITFEIFLKGEASRGELIMGNLAGIISDGVSLASLVMIIVILRKITSNQERKHAQLTGNNSWFQQ